MARMSVGRGWTHLPQLRRNSSFKTQRTQELAGFGDPDEKNQFAET